MKTNAQGRALQRLRRSSFCVHSGQFNSRISCTNFSKGRPSKPAHVQNSNAGATVALQIVEREAILEDPHREGPVHGQNRSVKHKSTNLWGSTTACKTELQLLWRFKSLWRGSHRFRRLKFSKEQGMIRSIGDQVGMMLDYKTYLLIESSLPYSKQKAEHVANRTFGYKLRWCRNNLTHWRCFNNRFCTTISKYSWYQWDLLNCRRVVLSYLMRTFGKSTSTAKELL